MTGVAWIGPGACATCGRRYGHAEFCDETREWLASIGKGEAMSFKPGNDARTCALCGKPITGGYADVGDDRYHDEPGPGVADCYDEWNASLKVYEEFAAALKGEGGGR